MTRVLVTGGTGFVGRHLTEHLMTSGYDVVLASRRQPPPPPHGPTAWVEFDLENPDRLSIQSLRGIDCVYHLAAKVHVMKSTAHDESQFDSLNTKATETLAMRAATAGVRRFVFLSSIKVNGERTLDRPFTSDDLPAPQDAYGRSKWRAEEALTRISSATNLEVVTVRPPLVYGPGVGANFRRLLALASRGFPLPLADVDNRRSLVSVWNLVDCLVRTSTSSRAPGHTWLVSDDEDVSTSQLLGMLHTAFGMPQRLFGVPVSVLKLVAHAVGRAPEVARMVESLQVSVTKTKQLLEWNPSVPLAEGLARTATWFQRDERKK